MPKPHLLIDCDGTCYPWITDFNGRFKQALQQTARDRGISSETYEMISHRVRGKRLGMMNFILALCQGDLKQFDTFTRAWCDQLDYTLIQPDPDLQQAFQETPLPYYILTNNCRTHLDRVWNRLFPDHSFSIPALSIEDTYQDGWFHPKQDPLGFFLACQKCQWDPTTVTILDDSAPILEIAARQGFQTRRVTSQYPLSRHLRELTRD